MNSKYFIYGLVDPETKEIRYIDKTVSGMKRPKNHNKPSQLKYDTHKTHWIKKLIEKGLKPEIIILQYHENKEELNESEQKWIAYYKSLYNKLTNATEGGEGNIGWIPTYEAKQKMSKKRSEYYDKFRNNGMDCPPPFRKLHIYDRNLELKECTYCKSWLELNFFYKCNNFWDGLQYMCKSCDNKRRKENRLKNPQYKRITTDEQHLEISKKKCEKMNASLTTEKRKKMASQPIACINTMTGEIKRYPSAKDAKVDGFHPTRISGAIKTSTTYNKHFFVKDSLDADIQLKLLMDVTRLNKKGIILAELSKMQKEMGLSDSELKLFMDSKDFKNILKEFDIPSKP